MYQILEFRPPPSWMHSYLFIAGEEALAGGGGGVIFRGEHHPELPIFGWGIYILPNTSHQNTKITLKGSSFVVNMLSIVQIIGAEHEKEGGDGCSGFANKNPNIFTPMCKFFVLFRSCLS